MNTIPFVGFPKIARLSRDVVISEKIDGTNSQILIQQLPEPSEETSAIHRWVDNGVHLGMWVGSRNKWISAQSDNYGFAKWVLAHAEELRQLGTGSHFGEWWGCGIQRGYGLKEKRFSLFNSSRWNPTDSSLMPPPCCHVVPVLAACNFDDINATIARVMDDLAKNGSRAAPGYMNPEGIVIFHTALNTMFKKTIKDDSTPKSLVQ